MRKTIAAVLLVLLIAAVIACSNDDASDSTAPAETMSTETSVPATAPPPSVPTTAPFSVWAPLEQLPEDYDSEQAARDGAYVNVHGRIANQEALARFLSEVEAGIPSFLRAVIYTVEGDPIIHDYQFDGEVFVVTTDATRDEFAAPEDRKIRRETFKYLILDPDGGFPNSATPLRPRLNRGSSISDCRDGLCSACLVNEHMFGYHAGL